jgi:hypothetical protein
LKAGIRGLLLDIWKFENNPGKQTALSLVCAVAGTTLIMVSLNFNGPDTTNSLTGFLLGIMLLIIGISAYLVGGKQTIIVDPKSRRIVAEDTNRFGVKKRLIPFSDIVDTGIGYLGKKSNNVNFYYIILKLRSGDEYLLFAPGRFFEGGSDRSVMESRRQRLEEYLKRPA